MEATEATTVRWSTQDTSTGEWQKQDWNPGTSLHSPGVACPPGVSPFLLLWVKPTASNQGRGLRIGPFIYPEVSTLVIFYSDLWLRAKYIQLYAMPIFTGRTDAEAPILWLPDAKSWLIGKDLDAQKDWRQEEKKADKMVGWHYHSNGHKFEQTPGDSGGQGSLVSCSPWDHKEWDSTDRLNKNNTYHVLSATVKLRKEYFTGLLVSDADKHPIFVRILRF